MQRVAAARTSFHIQPHEIASLKPKLAGLDVGFWVSKALFKMVGGINTELRTNEDTDFCLKLLSAGARCHHTPSHGAVIFQGDHGTDAASSTTKRYGPAQRARYFKHIVDTQAEILATDSTAEAWLWKRYLKMAARSGRMDGYHHLCTAKGLTVNRKRLLATYWAGCRIWRAWTCADCSNTLVPPGPIAWSKAATLYLLRRRSGKTGAQDPNRMRPTVHRVVRSKLFTL